MADNTLETMHGSKPQYLHDPHVFPDPTHPQRSQQTQDIVTFHRNVSHTTLHDNICVRMQVCYTGGFAAYLPSLAWPIFRRATAVMQIAIDQDRQILYTRSQAGVIVVCHSPGPCYIHQHKQQPYACWVVHTPLFSCIGFCCCCC